MHTLNIIFKEKELRSKCLITLFILVACQAVTAIPTPGVNTEYFLSMFSGNSAFGFLNMLTGNGLSRMTIGALGITPYITASIVIQLLAVVIPGIKELQKDGKAGQRKIEIATLVSGIILSFLQGLLLAIGFGKSGLLLNYKWYWVLLSASSWAVGTLLLALAGQYIKDHYFKNGISLILVAGILSSYPQSAANVYDVFLAGQKPAIAAANALVIFILLFLIFIVTVAVQEGEKTLYVTSSKRIGRNAFPTKTGIPIKLCPGGVVPVIFASTVFTIPTVIALTTDSDWFIFNMLNTSAWFDVDHPEYTMGAIIYIALILSFSILYTGIVFNPYEIADNLKKGGDAIAGVRPGKSTAEYIRREMRYPVIFGGVALCLIACIPIVVGAIWGLGQLAFLGTSLIIVIGVILEMRKQILTEANFGSYKSALKNGGIFHA